MCLCAPFYSRKQHPNETHTSTGAGYHHAVECMLAEDRRDNLQHQGLAWFTCIRTIQDTLHFVGIESEVKINLYDDVFEQVQISECHKVLHGLI